MGFFQKLKDWFTGKSSSSKSSSSSRSTSTTSGGGGRYDKVSSGNYGTSAYYRRALVKAEKERKEKKEKIAKAFKVKEFESNAQKAAAAKKAPTPIQQYKQNKEAERKAYNEYTNNKYNTKTGNKKHDAEARQRIKSGVYQSDPNAAKFEVDYHPIRLSAARGALNGVTFGASDLLAAKATSGEARKAEEYYQQNKNRAAEMAGDIAGSLIGFGITSGVSEAGVKALAKSLAPKAFEKGTARAVERAAASGMIRRAAEKEALKRFGISGATEEVVAQIARRRAERAVAELGKDAAINLTTGLAADINNSLVDSENWQEFMKNMGINAGLNVALGGATSLVPQFRVGKAVDTQALDGLVRNAAQNADNAIRPGEAVNIRNMARPQNLDDVARSADVPVNNQTLSDAVQKNQSMAEQLLKEESATLKVSAEKPKLDLNDDATAKGLIEKRDGLNKQLESVKKDFEDVKARRAAAEKGSEERIALDKEYKSLQRKRRRIEKQIESLDESIEKSAAPEVKAAETEVATSEIKPTEAAPAEVKPTTNDVNDFAQIGGNEAVDKGITPDAEVGKPPKVKKPEKKLKPNVVEQSQGNKMVGRVDKKLGKETGEAVKTPNIKDVEKVEAKYNKGQASNDKEVTSRAAVTIFRNSSSEEQAKRIKKMVNEDKYLYGRITNEGKMTSVAKRFHDNPGHYTKELMDYADGSKKMLLDDAVDVHYMSWYLVNHTGPMLKEHPELGPLHDAATELVAKTSSPSGQILQLNGAMSKASPLARRRSTLNIMANMLDASTGVRKKGVTVNGVKVKLSGDRDERLKQIIGLIEEDNFAKEALDKIQAASTEQELNEATANLLNAIGSLKTRTKLDVLQQFRIANMLGSIKTRVRNRAGNAIFGNMRQLSNALAVETEKVMASTTKSEFVKSELKNSTRGGLDYSIRKQARTKGEDLGEGIAKEAYDAYKSIESKLTSTTKMEMRTSKGKGNGIVTKAVDWWADVVSKPLEKDDAKALERNFREAYMKGAKRLEAAGKNLDDPEVKELLKSRATLEAQVSTFREYNAAADVLQKWANNLYSADSNAWQKVGGFAVEAGIPFRRTPMNILKQSVNYSPVGVFRGFSGIRKAAAEGNAELLYNSIDMFASGLTGTGIMAAGAMFQYFTDAFTTNVGRNEQDAKYMKQQGVQNYSVTFKEHSYTLDWLVPVSTVFFAGVELTNELKESGSLDFVDFANSIGKISSSVIEPYFETSMMSSVYNIFETLQNKNTSDDALAIPEIVMRELGQNWLNALVPTVVGQTAKTLYKSDMQLPSGVSDWEYWINSMKSKAGFANTDFITERLGPDTTAKGKIKNEKTTTVGELFKGNPTAIKEYGLSAVRNLVLPFNVQEVDLDDIDKERIENYRARVKAGEKPEDLAYMFPKKQSWPTFYVGDREIKMNNLELSTYNQAKQTGGAESMRYILENVMFNRPVEGPDGKKILSDDALTTQEKEKLIKQYEDKPISEVERWLHNRPEYKNGTDKERELADKGLWSLSKVETGYMGASKRSVGAKSAGEKAVLQSRGEDVDKYDFDNELSKKMREKGQELVDAGVASYKDLVDCARHGGKTYYYENDYGGYSQTYYNKTELTNYLDQLDAPLETKEALWDIFYSGKTSYHGSSGRGGYRRRGYRRRGRGGSSKKIVSQNIKTSAYKTKQFKPKVAVPATRSGGSSNNGAKTLAAALQDLQKVEAKIKPPKNK